MSQIAEPGPAAVPHSNLSAAGAVRAHNIIMNSPFGRAATAKAAILVTGSTYVSFFFGLIVSAIVARGVGPQDFGRYSFVVWVSGIFVLVANNGLTTTVLRFISESIGQGNTQSAGDLHGWVYRRQHISFLIAVVAFLATIQLTLPPDWKMPATIFVGVIAVSVAAKTYYIFDISAAKGYGLFVVEAYSTMIMSAINLVAVLVIYLLKGSVVSYLVLFAVANIGYYLIAAKMLRSRNVSVTHKPLDHELASRIKNHLFWTILLAAAGTLGNRAAETYLLSRYAEPAEIAFFAIGAALTRGGVELIAAGLNTVLMPLMAHGFGQGGTTKVHAILAGSVRLFGFGGLLLAGVGCFWAEPGVFLVYGGQYGEAVFIFRIMILVAGVTLAQGAFGALLSTTDNQRIRAGVAFGSVLVSVIAAWLLVPRFGLTGAVISSAASSIAIFLAVCIGIVKVFSVSLPWKEIGRLIAAAMFAAIVSSGLLLLGTSMLYQFIAGLVYLVVYVVATIVFRAWLESDIVLLRPLGAKHPKLIGRLVPLLERWMAR